MVARGSYGNPWVFRDIKHYLNTGELLPPPNMNERIRISTLQLEKSIAWKNEYRGITEIRKHWGDYFKGYPHFKPFRIKLMAATTQEEVMKTLAEIQAEYSD
jgi:tRNA-dihydrouridine synthase